MTKSALLTGALLIVAGGAIALFLTSVGLIPGVNKGPHPFQVPGDPPVTIGDGSLHVHSKSGWVKDNDGDTSIEPKLPGGGSLHPGCGLIVNKTVASAILWTDDDNLYDISPTDGKNLTVTIKHDSASAGGKPNVTVTISNGNSLVISTDTGSFDAERRGSRQHSRPGPTEQIDVTGASGSLPSPVWVAQSKFYPHYTLAFCYTK